MAGKQAKARGEATEGAPRARASRKSEGTAAGRRLIAAMEEGLAVMRAAGGPAAGEFPGLRTTVIEVPDPPAEYAPADVKRVRDAVGATQQRFAAILAVDVKTVQGWEQGQRTPSPMARRLLDVIAADPERWRARVTAR